MRLLPLLAWLTGGCTCAVSAAPASPFTARERAQGFRDHVILAKPLAPHRATVAEGERRERVRLREKFARYGDLRVLLLDDADAADRAIVRLRATGRYEFVERDRLWQAAAVPDDPNFTQQWALSNTGLSGGVAGADIRAVEAWDLIREAPGVIVAVLDGGVNIRHQDIVANIWRNPAPTFGDVNGASFINGVRTSDPSDNSGHGTLCAGIIGATGNNGFGISGVVWQVQIMPVRVASADGYCATSDFAAGLDYAISHGAHIVNVSIYTDTHSQADYAIVKAARDAGVILVSAAGNSAANIDTSPRYYPGSYPLDNMVSVGSSTRTETLAASSNYGALVDLVAPGSSIPSLNFANDTGNRIGSGTSFAAPHVVGALALLKARFPTDTYRQLVNRLHRGVDVLPAYAGKAVTGGRLNLFKALSTTDPRPFNDDFAARARLAGPLFTIRTNNTGAGAEAGEPAHAGAPAATTLWWEWTAPADSLVSVDTSGSGYDTVLAVYTGGAVDGLEPVAANDNESGSVTSRLSFAARAGVAYQIAVGGRGGASGATLVALGTVPANDAFAAAITLSGESAQAVGRNVLASREAGEPRILNNTGGASVWYRWVAPRTGRFHVSVATLNYFDPLLAIYTGTALNALTLVAASDNIGPGGENVDALCLLSATAGTTYSFSVESKLLPNTGGFTLSVVDALWQAPTLRRLTGAPAVAADGAIVAAGSDFDCYAFHPDGTLRWRRATQNAMERSTPAIGDDGTVYVYSLDGSLYAVLPDGTLRWRRDFGVTSTVAAAVVGSSPAIGRDGTVYIKAGDGYLHALEPTTGGSRWRRFVNAAGSPASPVVAADDTIYQGSSDQRLYAIAPDGSLRWSYDAGAPIEGSPALDAAGNLYFTVATSGRLHSVTPAGAARWTYAGATAGSTGSPALSADGATVYFGARDRRLHAVEAATGAERWKFTLAGEVGDSSPAIAADGVIYIGARDRRLYAITAAGTLKRTYDTGGAIESSPAIFGTTLYIGSDDAKLYAFDIGVGSALGPWPQYRYNARRQGRALADVPAIATAPRTQAVLAGAPLTLALRAAGGPPLAYQWFKDGVALPGATGATYTAAKATGDLAGSYRVSITNARGNATSAPAIVSVVAPGPLANVSRFVNLSILARLASATDSLTVGAVVGGAGTAGPKPVLMRAVGPALAAFKVDRPLADPSLALYSGHSALDGNDNWGGGAALAAAFAQVGAFPLATAASRDAALHLPALLAGNYLAQVADYGGATGAVLVEIYDASPAASFATTTPRLINLSALSQVGAGLTAGFVIAGDGAKTVLLRAVGPGLASFGVADALGDPRLELFNGAAQSIAANDNWGGAAELTSAFARAGAFALPNNSRDAALLATLRPGSYSAQATGAGTATGSVLIELYEVP